MNIRKFLFLGSSIFLFLLSTGVIYYFYNFSLASYVFWALSVSIFVLIFMQIYATSTKTLYEYLLIFEILYVRFVYAIGMNVLTAPYGLFGRDVHTDYTVTRLIMEYSLKYVQYAPDVLLGIRNYSKWPMIHLLAVTAKYTTGVSLFKVFGYLTITKLLPLLIFLVGLLFYYLGQRRIYGIKVASVSVLIVAFVLYHLIFHSWFVRETYAYAIFLYLFYLTTVVVDKNKKKMLFLSIIGILSILFAHHLTTFAFIIFLAVLGLSITLLKRHPLSLKFLGTLLIITLIAFISYTMYVGNFVFDYLVSNILALFNPIYSQPYYIRLSLHSAALLKYKIQVYLTLFYISIFTLIGIHKLVCTKRQTLVYWDIFGIIWGIFMSSVAVLNRIISNLPNVGLQRLLSFSWTFFAPPIVAHIFTNINTSRKNMNTLHIALAVTFMMSFLFFNLYTVPSYIYDTNSTPDYILNEASTRYNASHYLAAYWFLSNTPIDMGIYGDTTVSELFGGLGDRVVIQNIDIYKACDKTYFGGKWLAIRMENFNVIRCIRGFMKMPYSHLTTSDYYCITVRANKLYDGEDIQLFKFVEGS